MAYVITHFFEGGTADQYDVVVKAAHPGGVLPAGQSYHVSGPTEGGWLVVAVWDTKETYDRFMSETLMPALSQVSGGFDGMPQQREAEVTNLVTG
jgi:hypothetical protein